ncbi:MAG TPA: YHS domain-containing protein [Candidatus Limnocylindria bacterium]|nr:YHS domain-containing protein [Candidatus Limnocylindria bacterium]
METTMGTLPHDPVCGMTVEPAQAEANGLTAGHNGVTYYFCGRGCLLEFRDNPDQYLDPGYEPHM